MVTPCTLILLNRYVAFLDTVFRSVRAHSAATGKFSKVLIVLDFTDMAFSLIKNIGKLPQPNTGCLFFSAATFCYFLLKFLRHAMMIPTARDRALDVPVHV